MAYSLCGFIPGWHVAYLSSAAALLFSSEILEEV